MMQTFRPEELSTWLAKPWRNGMPAGTITGISHDTRTLEPGNLYVALTGENFDGHDFVRQAFEKGAAGALVRDGFCWEENPVLKVTDTLKGLQDLARGYRRQWTATTVVGITGSVGKTTMKEMCADVLSMQGPTHRTAGNYNNHIGLPRTMLSMPQDTRFGVFEIGMNHPGEIGALTDLLQPGIGMLTDIGGAHLEHFESIEAIAREKAELIAGVPDSGVVILDCESEWYPLMRRHTGANVVTVSLGGTADYAGRPVGRIVMNVNGFDYTMPLPGAHIMRNALKTIALGLELGMDPVQIDAGLQKFKLPPMRWEESDVRGIHFINDAYNANPLSMRAILRTFSDLPGEGKRWAVLGGMHELGEGSAAMHAELGCFIDGLALDGVITVGALGQFIACGNAGNVSHVLDAAAAAQILKDNLRAGDHVLLKASRSERLEQVLEQFKEI